MIRAVRSRLGDSRRQRDSVPPLRPTHSTAFTRRSLGLSTAPMFLARRSESGPIDPTAPLSTSSIPSSSPSQNHSSSPRHRSFDPLALVRRLPTRISGPCFVKSARHLAVFSRFERFWLELRGRLVVMFLHDNIFASSLPPTSTSTNSVSSAISPSNTSNTQQYLHPPPKDAVIVAVFTVEKCLVLRPRPKSPVLKISNPAHPHHIWLRFDTEQECAAWEKALSAVAAQRVVGISDFEFISPIGKGASGKVFLVSDRNTGEKLALKVIDKSKVFESKSSFRHALDERLALEMVDGHPFFSRLRYAFQTRAYFYLAIDFYDGGDLYQYLRTHGSRLREPQVRAVSAQVLLALEHLHSLGFVYRDLKPENVLLDSGGHVRLADFGLCKLLVEKSLTDTICGTHTYAAPEMLVRNYGKSIDLWAFGVFVYHILRGRTPYEAQDLDQVIANMNLRRIRFSKNTSKELVAMIKKLLDYNPNTRLGCGPRGMLEVRSHPFFKGVDWRRVYMRNQDVAPLFTLSKKQQMHYQQQQQQQQPNGRVDDLHLNEQQTSNNPNNINNNITNEHNTNKNPNLTGSTQQEQQRDNFVGIPKEGNTHTITDEINEAPGAPSTAVISESVSPSPFIPSDPVPVGGTGAASSSGVGGVAGSTGMTGPRSVRERANQLNAVARAEEMEQATVHKSLRGMGSGGMLKAQNVSSGVMRARRGRVSGTDSPNESRLDDKAETSTTGMASTMMTMMTMTMAEDETRGGREHGGGQEHDDDAPKVSNISNMQSKSVSLREQMAAAAEQDDLRNFDMSEWGKISVDNDMDDIFYGDGSLWPFTRTRRKLAEEERMIAGFGYCSCSTTMGLPDHL